MTTLAPPFSALLSPGTDDGRDADPRFREVMRLLAEPVVVITCADGGGDPAGLTVSSFASVSLAPPLVLFCAGHRSDSWNRIAANRQVRGQHPGGANADLAARFATRVDGLPTGSSPRLRAGCAESIPPGTTIVVSTHIRRAMVDDRRALIRITVQEAGPARHG